MPSCNPSDGKPDVKLPHPIYRTLGTLQSQLSFWKGQKRDCEVSCL